MKYLSDEQKSTNIKKPELGLKDIVIPLSKIRGGDWSYTRHVICVA